MFDGLERTWKVGARAAYELFPSVLRRNQLPSRLRKISASRTLSHATIQQLSSGFTFSSSTGTTMARKVRVTCLPVIVHRCNRSSLSLSFSLFLSLSLSLSLSLDDSIQKPFTTNKPFCNPRRIATRSHLCESCRCDSSHRDASFYLDVYKEDSQETTRSTTDGESLL